MTALPATADNPGEKQNTHDGTLSNIQKWSVNIASECIGIQGLECWAEHQYQPQPCKAIPCFPICMTHSFGMLCQLEKKHG